MFKPSRVVPVLFLVGSFATTACATSVYRSRSVYSQQYERRAYDNGFREGLSRGRDDAERGRQFSYARQDEYRDADRGYRRQDGNKDDYRRAFRQGYEAGYTESFNQIARTFPRTAPFPGRVRPGIYQS